VKILYLVNDDAFFVSHRLALGEAMHRRGWEVVVAAGESAAREKIEAAGLRFVPVPFDRGGQSPTRDLATLARITDLYRRERPDLVHHVTIKPVLYGSMAARTLGVPAVINAISGLGFVFTEADQERTRRAILRAGILQAYRAALGHPNSLTIFQNDDDREKLIDAGATTVDRTLLLRGSGVDLERFAASPLPDDEEPIVLLPARMLWDKGVGEFVEAARAIRREGIRARFVLAGGTSASNPVAVPENVLRAWQNEGVVEWWGHSTDMPKTLAKATLIALPSFYREGLPLALAEAAAAGRPVITTDMPGCRDAIVAGETGWLVPPHDVPALVRTLRRALADKAELRRRGAAGVILAQEDFDKKKIVAHHLAAYDRLVSLRFSEQRRSRHFAERAPIDCSRLRALSSEVRTVRLSFNAASSRR
jgi:glycosyltransferase involved in cell wall biosynthesis